MYSNEERMKFIKLYIEYVYNARAVIRELGYPSRNRLAAWYEEYCEHGTLERLDKQRNSKYTVDQRQMTVDFYHNNGRSVSKTIKALGYPGKTTLCDWLNEDESDSSRKWSCKTSRSLVRCTTEQKEQAVKAYCAGVHTPTELGKIYNVEAYTIYRWRDKLLGENKTKVSTKNKKAKNDNNSVEDLTNDKISLEMEVKKLEESVRRLRLE